jgi:hypothetical protein
MLMTASHRYALQIGEFDKRIDLEGRSRLGFALPPLKVFGVSYYYLSFIAPVFILSASLVLVCVGLFLPSFEFDIKGLLAIILGAEKSVRSYSVVTLGLAIPDGNPNPNSLGIRWIQLVYFLFIIVAVLLYHAILLILWCAPLGKKLQKKALIAAQIINAWSSMDVFVASIFASLLEIEQFANFIVGDKCDAIDKIVASYPKYADKIPGGPTCFALTTKLEPGFWILCTAAIVSSITGQIMIARCGKALRAETPQDEARADP